MRLRQEIKAFLMDEEAIGTVEVVLLLVVLIGLVIIFKKQIRTLLDSIFKLSAEVSVKRIFVTIQ